VNVVFLSPNFPPQFHLFCAALRAKGERALGIGDAPASELTDAQRAALDEYVYVPKLDDGDAVLRAVGYLTWKHGRIDRVESLNEHWLALEAKLREDFHVPGLSPAELALRRSKTGMDALFRGAGIPCPDSEPLRSPEQARAFAAQRGYPLVLKPDVGVGAARTFKIESAEQLESALAEGLSDYVIQAFVPGAVTTFDGITDREGRVVFAISFVYCAGVMDILRQQLDVYYYSRREIPPKLEELGRRMITAFDLREQFFHAELFELPGGSFRALEVNLRPPGGMTTDLMNYACDVDVYDLWARALRGDDLSGFRYEHKYHAAHASRRRDRAYRLGHDDLVRELGSTLVLHRDMPAAFATAMGDVVYMLRHESEEALRRAIDLVHAPA
jgi:hypothetical protein